MEVEKFARQPSSISLRSKQNLNIFKTFSVSSSIPIIHLPVLKRLINSKQQNFKIEKKVANIFFDKSLKFSKKKQKKNR